MVKGEAAEGAFIHIHAFVAVGAGCVTALEVDVQFLLIADAAFGHVFQAGEERRLGHVWRDVAVA